MRQASTDLPLSLGSFSKTNSLSTAMEWQLTGERNLEMRFCPAETGFSFVSSYPNTANTALTPCLG